DVLRLLVPVDGGRGLGPEAGRVGEATAECVLVSAHDRRVGRATGDCLGAHGPAAARRFWCAATPRAYLASPRLSPLALRGTLFAGIPPRELIESDFEDSGSKSTL